MKDTIKLRLSIYITLVIFLVGLVLSFFMFYNDWSDYKRDYSRGGMAVAERLGVLCVDEILRGDNLALYNVMKSELKSDGGLSDVKIKYLEALDRDGRPLAFVTDGLGEKDKAVIAARDTEASSVPAVTTSSLRLTGSETLVDTTYPVVLDGVRVGTIRAGMSNTLLDKAFYTDVEKAFGTLLAACLLGVFFGGKIAGWVSRPISALVTGAEEFSKGGLDYRVQVNAPRELKLLGESFNQMAESLKEKVDGLGRSKKEAERLSTDLAKALDESRQTGLRLQETNEWVTDLAFRLEEANQSLKAEKVQTDTIVHSIRDGIVALDSDENIMLMNPEAEDIFDTREEDMKGAPVQALVNRLIQKVDDPEEFRRKFMAATSNPEVENIFTVTLVRPFKRVLRRMSTAIRDEKGKVIGRVVTFRDITREKEVDDMKTNFVSTVSHELRTPLTSIKGAINLLLEGQVEDPETRAEFLRIAEQNTDRLISLITNLLDLSQIEEGRMRMKLAKVDMNAVVNSVLKSTGVLARQNGVTLVAACTDQPAHVMGDKEKVEQVVMNLVGNAIKFSEPRGKVTVSTSMVEDEVRLCVEDEGPGIPREKLDKIFDKFYQVDMTATRRKGGTGLGLTISKALIKEHGGRVWAESPVTPEGQGARFMVSLPKYSPAESVPVAPYSKPALVAYPPPKPERNENAVLIVDADPGLIGTYKRVFEHDGFRVLTATDGSAALKLAREEMPGYIFLDVQLKDMDGFVVASILRGDELTREIPIIFTGCPGEEGRQKCMALGDGYVVKPFQDNELISMVRNMHK